MLRSVFFCLAIASTFGQVCNRVTPGTIKDLDNLPLAQSGCFVTNIIKPYNPSTLPWNPSSVPSRGYYRLNMTFQEPSLITSCDFWASTDGSHNPTGLKFYDKPGGTLLASTSSFTTRMTQKSYNFLFIPPVVLPFMYVEIYKSTTWQVWVDTISCNTCYDPSETPTPSFSRFPTPSVSPKSPSVSSTEEPSPSLSESPKPVPSKSLTPSVSLSISSTMSWSVTPLVTKTPGPTVTSSPSNSLTPKPTKTPEATKTSETTGTPKATKTPQTTKSPGPTKTSEVTTTESPSITPVLKLSPSYSPINMSGLESLFSGNSTLTTLIQDSSQTQTLMGLSGAAIGVGGLSFLVIVYKFLAKKFAPGPDGKRPSISEVASSLFSSAKTKVTEIAKEVGSDIEEQVRAVVKDPKSAMGLLKDPKSALNFAKTGAAKTLNKVVKNNVPASESSVVLEMVNKVTNSPALIPVSQNEVEAEVPEVDITEAEVSTDVQVSEVTVSQGPLSVSEVTVAPQTHVPMTSIQVSEGDLEAVKQMLALMKKPHTVLPPNQS